MSALTDALFRALAIAAAVLILIGALLFVGLVLDVTGAEAAPAPDAGVRIVVMDPEPAQLPASLLRSR
jgi:uncharacterized membrane protein YdcZ (DUF606 family)